MLEITELEASVHKRQHENALRMLKYIFGAFESYTGPIAPDKSDLADNPELLTAVYTRISAAITALLADPAMKLSPKGFEMLSLHHKYIHGAFRMSGFGLILRSR